METVKHFLSKKSLLLVYNQISNTKSWSFFDVDCYSCEAAETVIWKFYVKFMVDLKMVWLTMTFHVRKYNSDLSVTDTSFIKQNRNNYRFQKKTPASDRLLNWKK